jgi:hypothetical protein
MKNMGIRWGFLSIVVLLLLMFAVGCETKKTGSANEAGKKIERIVFTPKNPCNLLTKDEVETVMKQKVRDPQPQDYACTYESIDSVKFTSLIFSLEDVDADGLFKGIREHFEKSGKQVKPVEGVGDSAFFQDKELHILKGKYFFHFQSSGNEGYELKEEAIKSLAKTAVDKLP